MPSRYNLPHIDVTGYAESQEYKGEGSGGGGSSVRVRDEHGRRLQNELRVAFEAQPERAPDPRLPAPTGTYIEVELRRGTPADKLDLDRQDIRTGATKSDQNNVRTIALFVPNHARAVLEQIVADYLNPEMDTPGGSPKRKDKVESIEAIRRARLSTLWTDLGAPVPDDPQYEMWWALWCHPDSIAEVADICARLEVRVAARDRWLFFPEVTVMPVFATRATIELMIFATGGVAELRRASDSPTFFTDEIRGEQGEWVDNLAERITWPPADAPAVCVFDTGVNRGHALIEPALAPGDMHALRNEWGTDDHHNRGHGTSMAGLSLHGDLTASLGDGSRPVLTHRLESVKVLPPRGFDANDPKSFGVLTQSATVMPEIVAPARSRVYCMAVTNDNVSGSTASSWSAAIDQAASGRMIADDPAPAPNGQPGDDNARPKRLFIVSCGNIPPELEMARIQPQDNYPIEDPAQAWNALTIGGCTDLTRITDAGLAGWTAAVNAGELSPHSRTSANWPQGSTPIKPELVMEAGNRAISPNRRDIVTPESLSLLTTGKDVAEPLVSFDASSAAAAQAARMAAALRAAHPDYWPETIRAMMVHGAEWTGPMSRLLNDAIGKRARYQLVRRFGYGVPDFDRAVASARNHLALFAQANIQPFKMEDGRKFNTCHYYKLPIPADMLERLENEQLEMKVTLSYFIDPNPGLAANVDPQRYQSHGLRFDHQRRNESVARFKARVNPAERDDGRRPNIEGVDQRWLLGEDSISAGSLHCDVWRGPAIELLNRDLICVKPVNGWWRNRASPKVVNRSSRYALIVSLKALNPDIDIYTPISVRVGVPVPVEIEIENRP